MPTGLLATATTFTASGAAALRGACRSRVPTRIARSNGVVTSASYWEDIAHDARHFQTLDASSDKVSARTSPRPSRHPSSRELWAQAQSARAAAKSVCAAAALSIHGASFSQLHLSNSCALEWRKVEHLENAAKEAFQEELVYDSVADPTDEESESEDTWSEGPAALTR